MHICLGTPGLPFDDEHAYTLNVLNTVLGGGLSSRLFQSIREDRGLAYAVYSYLSSYQDAGLFTLYAGTRPANAQAVVALMQLEMKNLRDQGISPTELARAKEYIKGNLLLGLENTSSRMTRLGKLELTLNKIIGVEEVIDRIERVSVSDVAELAKRLFVADATCITALGPSKSKFKIAL
jgi:predicted Zn-dependent peptidase